MFCVHHNSIQFHFVILFFFDRNDNNERQEEKYNFSCVIFLHSFAFDLMRQAIGFIVVRTAQNVMTHGKMQNSEHATSQHRQSMLFPFTFCSLIPRSFDERIVCSSMCRSYNEEEDESQTQTTDFSPGQNAKQWKWTKQSTAFVDDIFFIRFFFFLFCCSAASRLTKQKFFSLLFLCFFFVNFRSRAQRRQIKLSLTSVCLPMFNSFPKHRLWFTHSNAFLVLFSFVVFFLSRRSRHRFFIYFYSLSTPSFVCVCGEFVAVRR